MSVYQADAIVIRSREYGESDRLLTLFSREQGKLQAIAKGVRKPKSRQRAGAQLFTYADYLLYKGHTLDTVNEASPRESFPHLWNDFERSLAATAMAELLDAATLPGQPHPELFTLTLTGFFLLEHYSPFLMQGAYALRLLHILGYHPRLENCAECGAKVEGSRIFFSPVAGGIVCSHCRGAYSGRWVAAGSLAFMRQLLYREMDKLDRLRWNSSLRDEVLAATEFYCEQKFERRLRSWQMRDLSCGSGSDYGRESDK
ncbi:DNA repair protein RecO [Peptococcaceae bacterium CEB3]|nr:DNA repair protein RecO [Peptococcaceae bacterium CEB3]